MAGGIKDPGEAPDLNDVIALINRTGGGSSVNSYNSGGNTAKAEADKLKRYIKSYRALLIGIYGMQGGVSDWQKRIMAVAAKQELPTSVFLSILRRYDPRYVRTDEYKSRAADATKLWKQYYPKAGHAPNGLVTGFARSGKNGAWLLQRLQQTKAYKRDYKYMDVAEAAGSQAGSDPGAYRTYRDALNASYQNFLGRAATPLEQKMMFHSGMTDAEFGAALANVFGGTGSFQWATGMKPPTRKLQTAAFGAKTGDPLYGAIAQAKTTQEKFMGGDFKPFDLGVLEDTGNVVMPRI